MAGMLNTDTDPVMVGIEAIVTLPVTEGRTVITELVCTVTVGMERTVTLPVIEGKDAIVTLPVIVGILATVTLPVIVGMEAIVVEPVIVKESTPVATIKAAREVICTAPTDPIAMVDCVVV